MTGAKSAKHDIQRERVRGDENAHSSPALPKRVHLLGCITSYAKEYSPIDWSMDTSSSLHRSISGQVGLWCAAERVPPPNSSKEPCKAGSCRHSQEQLWFAPDFGGYGC
jgi:hypothetical protein